MATFANSITLTKSEALDLLAALDDAAAALTATGELELAFEIDEQIRRITNRLTS